MICDWGAMEENGLRVGGLTDQLCRRLVGKVKLRHESGGIVDVRSLHDDRKNCDYRECPARRG